MAQTDAYDWHFLGKYDRLCFVRDVVHVAAFCSEDHEFDTVRKSLTGLLLAAHEVLRYHLKDDGEHTPSQ